MSVFTALTGLLGVVAGVGITYIYFKKKEKKQSKKAVEEIQKNPTESWIDALKDDKAKRDKIIYQIPKIEEPLIKKLLEEETIKERPEEEIEEDLNIETSSNEDKVNDLINKFQTELNTLKSEGSDLPKKEGEFIKEELKKSPAPSPKSNKKKK